MLDERYRSAPDSPSRVSEQLSGIIGREGEVVRLAVARKPVTRGRSLAVVYVAPHSLPHPKQNLILLNSITSTGHSGQLCTQHTIRSHPLGRWPCRRKLRLSFSNSIFTSCQR